MDPRSPAVILHQLVRDEKLLRSSSVENSQTFQPTDSVYLPEKGICHFELTRAAVVTDES